MNEPMNEPINEPMDTPRAGQVYRIRLCSGEERRWRFSGIDTRGLAWWCDEDSGSEFSEASLMYAWELLGEAPGDDAGPRD